MDLAGRHIRRFLIFKKIFGIKDLGLDRDSFIPGSETIWLLYKRFTTAFIIRVLDLRICIRELKNFLKAS
jgi:hypothetical protein